MKKTLFTMLCTAMLTMFGSAAFAQSGDQPLDAITFDWTSPIVQNGNTDGVTKWYKVDLTALRLMDKPSLRLVINNRSTNEIVRVEVDVFDGPVASDAHFIYGAQQTLAPGASLDKSRDISFIKALTLTTLYVRVTLIGSGTVVDVNAEKFETPVGDDDENCMNSTDFAYGSVGYVQTAGSDVWYKVNLTSAQGKEVTIGVENLVAEDNAVEASLYMACNAAAARIVTRTLAPNQHLTKQVGAVISSIATGEVYVRIKTQKKAHLYATIDGNLVPTETLTGCATATPLVLNSTMTAVQGTNLYYVNLSELANTTTGDVRVTVAPKTAGSATVQADAFFVCGAPTNPISISRTLTGTYSRVVARDYLEAMNQNEMWVRVQASKEVEFTVTTESNEGHSCAEPIDLVYGAAGHNQDGNTEKWYKIDLAQVRGQEVIAGIKNMASVSQKIEATLYMNCNAPATKTLTRTFAANEDFSKEVGSIISAMGADVVYVRIKSERAVNVYGKTDGPLSGTETLTGCEDAITFVPNVTMHAEAGSQLYYVNLADLAATTAGDAVLKITPKTSGPCTIIADAFFACGVAQKPIHRTQTFNGDFIYTISRDIVESFNKNEMYVRINASKAVDFTVEMISTAGKDCADAIDFDWQHGNTQAAGTHWYRVAFDYPKTINNGLIRIHVENLAAVPAHVDAKLSFTCPFFELTSLSFAIPAHGVRPSLNSNQGVLTSALYRDKNEVFIMLKSDQPVRIWADVEEDVTDVINACVDAQVAELDHVYTFPAGEVWYQVSTDAVRNHPSKWAVPEVTFVNTTDEPITAQFAMAFECPVVGSMLHKSITVPAHGSYSKHVERSLIDNYVNDFETLYVRVIGGEGLEASATMVDSHMGEECLNAIMIDFDSVYTHPAGDRWYVIDVEAAKGKDILAGFKNMSGTAQTVTAEVWLSCDADAPLQVVTRTLGANATSNRSVGNILNGLSVPYVFVRLSSETELEVWGLDNGNIEQGDPIDICDQTVVELMPNIHYQLGAASAAEGAWYSVNLELLKEYTSGDVTLTIQSVETEEPVDVAAKLYWACATTEKPSTRTQTVDGTYVRTFTREAMNILDKKVAFVNIAAQDSIDFIFECETHFPDTEVFDTIATTICYGDDFVDPFGLHNLVGLTADTIFEDTIHFEINEWLHGDSIRYYQITVLPEILPTTVNEVLCVNETYMGKFYNEGGEYNFSEIYVSQMTGCDSLVNYNVKVLGVNIYHTNGRVCHGETVVWGKNLCTTDGIYVDTIEYANYACDSVIRILNLTVLPEATTFTTNMTICAGETTTWGNQTCSTTGQYIDAIKFAQSNCDSIVNILNLVVLPEAGIEYVDATICNGESYNWHGTTYNIAGDYTRVVKYTNMDCDSVEQVLRLRILPVAETITTDVTVCAGETYNWFGQNCNATGTYTHTVKFAQYDCDSLYQVLNLTVLPAAQTVYTDVTICDGEVYNWLGNNYTTAGEYTNTVYFAHHNCDSLYQVLRLNVRDALALPTGLKGMPHAICGQPVDFSEVNDELNAYIANLGANAEQGVAYHWQMLVNGSWVDFNVTTPLFYQDQDCEFRFVLTSECGTVLASPAYVVTVAAVSNNNLYAPIRVSINSKFDNQLVMVDLNDLNSQLTAAGLPHPTENQVVWYVNGVQVGTGFYYAADHTLTGTCVAVIELTNPFGSQNECGIVLYSGELRFGAVAAAPAIQPTLLNAGEPITISNLDPEQVTKVDVYDNMGKLIETFNVMGEATYQFVTPVGMKGYFMMNISSEDNNTSLKYITK
ncbi:MAG: hypothetical protein MJZ89_01705 [Paludibacteraceae bacterium]|nr:hypothetical protein [Paludibacteraceae bacterium]